jgi:rhodanese-related sulfurtransferase
MYRVLAVPLLVAAAALPAAAQPTRSAPSPVQAPLLNPQMDFEGYRALIEEVRPYRRARLIDWNTFAAAARQRNVLLLDARSERQFAEGHIRGAVNVPLTEFSVELLAEVIGPDRNRPILIYCNNNFRNDRPPAILKSGRLALNLSTFTHLYGYGYRNIRELNDVMDFNDPRVRWVSSPAPAAH